MFNKSKKLFLFILELNNKINKESENIYRTLLKKYLQETSHSFGFKPYSELSDYIVKQIEKIHNNCDYSYYLYDSCKKKSVKQLFKKLQQDNDLTKEYLILILNVLKKLSILDLEMGKHYAMLLEENIDCSKTQKFNCVFTFKLIKYIIDYMEQQIYSNLHNLNSEEYKNYGGLFYWFCFENDFGKKQLILQMNFKKQKIKNNIDFIKWLIKFELFSIN